MSAFELSSAGADGATGATGVAGATGPTGPSGSTVLFDSTLGADTTSIDTGAAGIAGGFNVLEVWIIARTSEAVTASAVLVTVNNDTGANYDRQVHRMTNVTVAPAIALAGTSWALGANGDSQEAGAASSIRFSIPGYAQTTFHKSTVALVTEPDDTAASVRIESSLLRWKSTAAISRMAVAAASGNLRAGSRLLIYGR